MRPIDADALIKKYGDWYVEECTESGFIGTLKNLLATEPTIQPQSTDLIDRQAAIDAIISEPLYESGMKKRYADAVVPAIYEKIKSIPPAQPEPQEGHWIKHETPDGGEQYECSRCGVLWEFNDGTPEDNEAYFCPKCGVKMKGERQK